MAHGTGAGKDGEEREAQRERAPRISFASAPNRVGMRPSMWQTSNFNLSSARDAERKTYIPSLPFLGRGFSGRRCCDGHERFRE